jgi:hypothetical protein
LTSPDNASLEVESKIKEFLIDFLKESLKIAESNQNKLKISDEIFPELKNGHYYKNTTKKNKNYGYFVDHILINEIKNLSSFQLLNMYFSEQPIKNYYRDFYFKLNQNFDDVQDLTADILKRILTYYLKLQNNFSFDENSFNQVYKSLMNFLKNFNQDEYVMPLHHFQSDLTGEPKKFGNITLRRITDNELRVFSGMNRNPRILDSYKTLSHVVVFLKNSSNDIVDFDKAKDEFRFFINALSLNFKGELNISTLYKNFEHPWKVFQTGKKVDYNNTDNSMYFSTEKYNSMLNFYHRFKKSNVESKENAFVKMAILRFQIGLNRNEPADKIIDYNTCLESLYASGPGDLTRKISQRGSMILATTEEERESVYKFLKFVYNLRSGLVHGEGVRNLKYDGKNVSIEDVSYSLEEYARSSIKVFLKLIISYNGNDKNKKIVSDIDMSLINRKKYLLLKSKF